MSDSKSYSFVNVEALVGFTKTKFKEHFKPHARNIWMRYGKTLDEVWEDIRKDIPKK